MSCKKKAEELYNDYCEQLKEFMSDTTTTSTYLNSIGKELFEDKYIGTFAYDLIPKKFGRSKGFIFNLDKSKEVNREHWVAIYKYKYNKGTRILFYDSFGRKHTTLLPDLKKFYNKEYVHDTELDDEQKKEEQNCGLRCMAFLAVCINNGVQYARYI